MDPVDNDCSKSKQSIFDDTSAVLRNILELIMSVPADVEILRLLMSFRIPAGDIEMGSIKRQSSSGTNEILLRSSVVKADVKKVLRTVGQLASGTSWPESLIRDILS